MKAYCVRTSGTFRLNPGSFRNQVGLARDYFSGLRKLDYLEELVSREPKFLKLIVDSHYGGVKYILTTDPTESGTSVRGNARPL